MSSDDSFSTKKTKKDLEDKISELETKLTSLSRQAGGKAPPLPPDLNRTYPKGFQPASNTSTKKQTTPKKQSKVGKFLIKFGLAKEVKK